MVVDSPAAQVSYARAWCACCVLRGQRSNSILIARTPHPPPALVSFLLNSTPLLLTITPPHPGSSFNGSSIATSQDVIVVTTNYRLGALGMLARFTPDGSPSGNFAYLDQRSALRWVQREIEAFGGDAR